MLVCCELDESVVAEPVGQPLVRFQLMQSPALTRKNSGSGASCSVEHGVDVLGEDEHAGLGVVPAALVVRGRSG